MLGIRDPLPPPHGCCVEAGPRDLYQAHASPRSLISTHLKQKEEANQLTRPGSRTLEAGGGLLRCRTSESANSESLRPRLAMACLQLELPIRRAFESPSSPSVQHRPSSPLLCPVRRPVFRVLGAYNPQAAARWSVRLGAVTFESSRGRVRPRFTTNRHSAPLVARFPFVASLSDRVFELQLITAEFPSQVSRLWPAGVTRCSDLKKLRISPGPAGPSANLPRVGLGRLDCNLNTGIQTNKPKT